MSLPEQVRRQAERAQELVEQMQQPPADLEADPPADPQPVGSEPQPAEPPADPSPQPTAEPPAPADAPSDPPQPAPTIDAAGWEQRFRSLQGIFNSEKRGWTQEKEQLQERLRKLEERLTAEPAPPAQPPRPKRITEKDLETYGPELLDVIARQAEERAEALVEEKLKQLQPVIDQTREQVGHVSTQVYRNEQERFFGELAKAVPDFQEVNADQRWLDWLAETDQMAGVPRQAFLNDAQSKLDYTRVARLFQAFKATLAPTPAAALAPAKAPPLSPSPRGVGTASAHTPREPRAPSVSRSEIAAHYRRSSTDPGYRASAEYKAMEERIFAATSSGQVVEA